MKKSLSAVTWAAAVVVASSLAIVVPALAQTGASIGVQGGIGIHNGPDGAWRGGMSAGAGIVGTVSAINGSTLTITAFARPPRPMPMQASGTPATGTSTAYTVNAANAKIYKGNATTTVTVSSIAIGDTVMVQGALSGTNITATVIRDGVALMPMMKGDRGRWANSTASGTPFMQGNGQPVIGGSITAINGTTITVTNASNVTYTINAASSTIVKGGEKNGTSTTLSSLAVGDNVIVQGTVNGTSVTASSIIDQGVKNGNDHPTTTPHGNGFGAGFGGFFGAIGGFFKHLFGF